MKRYIKSIAILPLAVMFFTAALAVTPTANAETLRVKGSLDATESHVVTPPTMRVDLEGTGCATVLGHYILTLEETVTLPALNSSGEFAIDSLCGDQLFGSVVGQGTIINAGSEASIAEVYTITGGTGRFAGATGAIAVNRVVDRTTLISSGTIDGIVTLPDHGRGGRRN